MVELKVRDNGIGAAETREGSLGYGLIRSMVEQIKASFVENDNGVAVTISFPDPCAQPHGGVASH